MKQALTVVLALAWLVRAGAAEVLNPGLLIQEAPLDETRPYFVATHPRVTTTVRFPGPIEAPEGAMGVFAEDPGATHAEYLISWQTGDPFFTLAPGREAKLANLNVPFEGRTFALYFYPVADALKAAAVVNLTRAGERTAGLPGGRRDPAAAKTVRRSTEQPARTAGAAGADRLLGFLDRLKLVHAVAPGRELLALAKAMAVEVVEIGVAGGPTAPPLVSATADAGWYQIVLLRAVRDPRMNAIGFVGLLRNISAHTLVFDPASFGVRAGGAYYSQSISDAPAVLPAGAQSPIYFVIQPGAATPLSLANGWRASVDLLSPAMNPGAALLREYAHGRTP